MRFIFVLALISLALLAGTAHAGQSARVKSDPAITAAVKVDAIFRLFPKHVGTFTCRIPRGGPTVVMIHGTCSTQERIGPGYSGFVTVTFKETWNAKDFHSGHSPAKGRLSHTWRVSETASFRVVKVHSAGDWPPQFVI